MLVVHREMLNRYAQVKVYFVIMVFCLQQVICHLNLKSLRFEGLFDSIQVFRFQDPFFPRL